jgi:hypothetical protein
LTAGHVFGYASLVVDGGPRARPAVLSGYRVVWGVATDNRLAIPGYKMYLRRSDGARPAVYVAFLDLEPDRGGQVGGIVKPVTEEELAGLDARERNYDRIEVSGELQTDAALEGPVWAYRGSREGRERLRRGRDEGRAVVSRDYAEKVVAGFRLLGDEEQGRRLTTRGLDRMPVWDLQRIDLPPDPPVAQESS